MRMAGEGDFYTLQEAADILGTTSEDVEQRLQEDEQLPYRRGESRRIPSKAVDRLAQRGGAQSTPPAAEADLETGVEPNDPTTGVSPQAEGRDERGGSASQDNLAADRLEQETPSRRGIIGGRISARGSL